MPENEKQTHIPVQPYHSTKPNSKPVYHIFEDCIDGNNIEDENRKNGKGKNRGLCQTCRKMQQEKLFVEAKEKGLADFKRMQERNLSRIALIRPPMIGIMEPLRNGDLGVSDGACN